MTVRPPGGPTDRPDLPVDSPRGSAEPRPGDTFADAVGEARTPSAAEPAGTSRAGDPIGALLEEALADPLVAMLSPERRQALREELEALLASDPVLAGLGKRLPR